MEYKQTKLIEHRFFYVLTKKRLQYDEKMSEYYVT